jgi:predicted TPR repeat methyltransferase
VASDSFIYTGNLKPTFQAIAKNASPNAYILFSVEKTDIDSYKLKSTGRFAHSVKYITELADSNSMSVVSHQEKTLRKDKDEWIEGDLFLLRMNS